MVASTVRMWTPLQQGRLILRTCERTVESLEELFNRCNPVLAPETKNELLKRWVEWLMLAAWEQELEKEVRKQEEAIDAALAVRDYVAADQAAGRLQALRTQLEEMRRVDREQAQ